LKIFSQEYGVSRERVRQIEVRRVRKASMENIKKEAVKEGLVEE
jgi:DNA-directed RNA polymerase sigma subunit (sigma70/sigma32)